MGGIHSFEDLQIWQQAFQIAKQTFELTATGAFERDWAFRDQLRRCVVSTMANIAEGFERDGNAEFIHFLSISKGSCGEFRSHLELAKEIGYLNEEKHRHLKQEALFLSRRLASLIRHLRTSPMKGRKRKS